MVCRETEFFTVEIEWDHSKVCKEFRMSQHKITQPLWISSSMAHVAKRENKEKSA